MAIDFCALCNDPCTGANASIGNNNFQETWRTLVAQALCGILAAAQSGPTPVDLVNIPAQTVAFGSVGVAYGTTGFVVSGDLSNIAIQNNTNQDVQISYDGGSTNGPVIPIGEFREFDFGASSGVMPATTIFIKYINVGAPTIGQVVIDGYKRP